MPAVSPDLDARERACVEEVLRTAQLAYVAMVEEAGPRGAARPYVVPMNFAYQTPEHSALARGAGTLPVGGAAPKGHLYLHTGPGRKQRALGDDPRVCISVIAQEKLELGPTPCDDGYLYQSVVLEGRAVLLTEAADREAALRLIVAKYDPEAVARAFKPAIFAKTLMYVVEVESLGFKERPKRR